jgi:uncharacterized protein
MKRPVILFTLIWSALALSALVSAAATTNLATWEVISNKWHSVPTNEVVLRAFDGDASAQCYLGKAYFGGVQGFPTNFATGREWMLKSADSNLAQAQNTLGFNAANGIGTETNFDEALKWYRKAAEQGFSRAEVNIGRMYWRGQGVAQDVDEAAKWFLKAAEHGLALAKSDLGFLLMDEQKFGPTEKAEGVKWIREAAAEGDARAQNRLGWILWKGLNVEADVDSAKRWFVRSAEQGLPTAMENLFLLAGEAQDHATLTNLFATALKHAERGAPEAEELVARMYSTGLGVTQDRGKEIAWLEKAAAQDYLPAILSAGDGSRARTRWQSGRLSSTVFQAADAHK